MLLSNNLNEEQHSASDSLVINGTLRMYLRTYLHKYKRYLQNTTTRIKKIRQSCK